MWLKWEKGRQGSGYSKMLLLTAKWPVPFDIYILKYPPESYIDWHTDPSKPGYEHHRINIILKQSDGYFMTRQKIGNNLLNVLSDKRFIKFRPDITLHSVTKCTRSRYVLSIGYLLKEKAS